MNVYRKARYPDVLYKEAIRSIRPLQKFSISAQPDICGEGPDRRLTAYERQFIYLPGFYRITASKSGSPCSQKK